MAVIRGSAVNNDGAAKIGFTAPGVDGQAEVITEALAVADVEPETVGYVEAHGTATPMGDPIEVAALNRAFRAGTARRGFCALGSLKGNLGHLDAASGVAGLIKAALAVRGGPDPAQLHFHRPNPEIDFASSPFTVARRCLEWASSAGAPRRAGVSSFGVGGTNAHLVLEQAPPRETTPARRRQVLLLSARDHRALDAAAGRLAQALPAAQGAELADAAFTLQTGRTAFAHRLGVVCSSVPEAVRALGGDEPARCRRGQAGDPPPPVVFLFPGQGAQVPGMGRRLYAAEPVFRDVVDECAERLRVHLPPEAGEDDLRHALFAESTPEAVARLDDTALAQPALFVVEYALARLWHAWGVVPAAMLGHSVGELVAACLGGVFELPAALALVAARGRAMAAAPPGAMLAVAASAAEVEADGFGGLTVAVDNAPRRCVLSGPPAAIDEAARRLAAAGVGHRRLHASRAFHSPAMAAAAEDVRHHLSGVALRPPAIPFVSNVSGRWITAREATDPGYWATHLRQRVLFRQGLEQLRELASPALLEVGPGRGLAVLAEETLAAAGGDGGHPVLPCLPGARDAEDGEELLLAAAAALWTRGVGIDWSGPRQRERREPERRRRIALPAYPFARRAFWIDPPEPAEAVPAPAAPAAPAAAAGMPVSGGAVERLVQAQLDLLEGQLRLLRGPRAAAAGSTATGDTPPAGSTTAEDSGAVPWTPVQREILELAPAAAALRRFSIGHTWELRGEPPVGVLRRALLDLDRRRDALRLRLRDSGAGWELALVPAGRSLRFTRLDLGSLPGGRRGEALRHAARAAGRGIDAVEGPLGRAVFAAAAGDPPTLHLALHHLAADVWSWRLLVADLDAAVAGTPPPAAGSYVEWARCLERHASTPEVRGEADAWAALAAWPFRELPATRPRRRPGEASGVVERELAGPAAGELLGGLPRRHRVQPHVPLLAALSAVLVPWAGGPVLAAIEGHGREPVDGVEPTDVVGWMTTLVPLPLEVAVLSPAETAIEAMDRRLAAIPRGGMGFGLLRSSLRPGPQRDRLRRVPPPQVVFHFAAGSPIAAGGTLVAGNRGVAGDPAAAAPLLTPLEVSVAASGGALRMRWRFGGGLERGTVEALAGRYVDRLLDLAGGAAALADIPHATVPEEPSR